MDEVIIGKVYRHFKGKYIFVENLGKYSETGEVIVIYKGLNDGGIFARPLNSFLEEIDPNRDGNATHQSHRFELYEF